MSHNTKTTFPRTIGMDLGVRSTSFCSVDQAGEIQNEGVLKTTKDEMGAFFRESPTSRIVIEASGPSRWVAALATEHGHEVIVANPREFKLISQSHRKTDRNDARILADFGQFRPNLLKPVQLRGLKCQVARATLAARSHVVRQRTLIISLIRAQVRNMGVSLPTCGAKYFSRRAVDAIPLELQPALLPLFQVLEALAQSIAAYDVEIERLGESEFPETKILRQVSGVGPNTALAFIATVEDPKRFERSRDVGAYVGLVSRSRSSGSKDPQLRISKRGDKVLRRLLVTSATYICGPRSKDSDLKRFALRLQERGGQSSKAKARIAVARKLSVLLHRLLVTGEVYEPMRNTKTLAA